MRKHEEEADNGTIVHSVQVCRLQTLPLHTPPSHPSTLLHSRPLYDLGWLMLAAAPAALLLGSLSLPLLLSW